MTIPPELADNRVVKRLEALRAGTVTAASAFRGELAVVVPPGRVGEVCELLRSDPELGYNLLVDITAVDHYPVEPRFEVVYHLRAMRSGQRLRLKAPLGGEQPQIDSVVSLWPAADMLEREVFDLFGIHFSGHPRLRRLLMPDDWQGHPLRKDYPVEGYR